MKSFSEKNNNIIKPSINQTMLNETLIEENIPIEFE